MNGILIDGKFYEAVYIEIDDNRSACVGCELYAVCGGKYSLAEFCTELGVYTQFRFSQELTDRIKRNE